MLAAAGLVLLSDRFTTGSSIMPQKRNPDAAELVRAKTGRIIGSLQALLIVMKGLPLAYQKDMQEDKEGTIEALSALMLSIAAMTGMVRDMLPDANRMRQPPTRAIRPRRISPTGWCRRSRCRSAMPTMSPAGSWRGSRGEGCAPPPAAHEMQMIEPRITKDVFEVLSADNSVKSRASLRRHRAEERAPGGKQVAQAIGAGARVSVRPAGHLGRP